MLTALKRYATPPSTLAGRLSLQSLIFASGDGTFLAGSAVFFTHVVGLSLGQVGIGLTVAAIASFVVAVPMGKLVDHFGPKRMWALSAVIQGALFAGLAVHRQLPGVRRPGRGHGGRRHAGRRRPTARTSSTSCRPAERVESRAYMYSALNVGFSLGALHRRRGDRLRHRRCCGGPLFSAVLFVANSVAILRLPDASHDVRSSRAARSSPRASPRSATAAGSRSPPSPASCGPTRCCCTR